MAFTDRLHNRGSISTGYDVDYSVKLQEAGVNTEFFSYTVSSTGNRTTGTISMWVKRTQTSSDSGTTQYLFEMGGTDNNTDRLHCRFNTNDTLNLATGSTNWRITDRVFRDTDAWYHFVFAIDTTQATAADRVKIYINGVQETDFTTSNNPGQNDNTGLSYQKQVIGFSEIDNTGGFNGYLSEVCIVDGNALQASDFGTYDTASGIWRPKDITGTSVGTNGSLMKFANAAGMGANSASAGHGFSVQNVNQNDQAHDTPTNNFMTISSETAPNKTVKYGGTLTVHGSTGWTGWRGSYGVSAGKWYVEGEIDGIHMFGINSSEEPGWRGDGTANNGSLINTDAKAPTVSMHTNGRTYVNGSYTVSPGTTLSSLGGGDQMMMAIDMDNRFIYFGKNGTWQNSGDPTSGALGTGGFPIYDDSPAWWYISVAGYYSNENFKCLFGGSIGAYIPTSLVSDANGYGMFEYTPPTGYYAICSKNLAEYG